MTSSRKQYVVGVVRLLCLMSGLGTTPAQACGVAIGPHDSVQIAEEDAAIIWDPAHGMEHFVRKATFNTRAKNFGFLVPTPATPELAEAKSKVFDHLERLAPLSGSTAGGASASMSSEHVEIIKSQRVGGLDAVVLQANDARALSHWLRIHGYAARPALKEWLAAYVAKRWKITAFKIATGGGPSTGVVSTVVRMSFPCSKPYFPYREPSDQRKGVTAHDRRRLDIYFLSNGPMEGSMAHSRRWPGQAFWRLPVDESERASLASELSIRPDQLPQSMWLTFFRDDSSPRPGTDDVYFRPGPPKRGMSFSQKATMSARHSTGIGVLIAVLLGIAFMVSQARSRRRPVAPYDADV